MELRAVVEGDRLELAAVPSDRPSCRPNYFSLGARLEFLHDREAGLALHQREHAVVQVAAHHRVAFPMAGALSSFDLYRTFAGISTPGLVLCPAGLTFAHGGLMGKGRLEAFSDGVLAIIITIMVLELKVPHGESIAALAPLIPAFFSYVLSFIYLGIYWNNHHHMLHASKKVSGRVLW